ncbi:MAG: EAL domain-containing protein [Pseudomonadota bacterium]
MVSVPVRFCLVFVTALVCWLASGHYLHRHMILQSNIRHLEETANLLVQRVERSVDFVVIASTELLLAGEASCSDEAISLLRKLVLRTSTVSDIFLVAENRACSSFSEVSPQLPDAEMRSTWTQARNPSYRLGSIVTEGRKLLAVSWGLGTDLEIVSAINADAILFDVLASELRSQGSIALYSRDDLFASLEPENTEQGDATVWTRFIAEGERYPVRIEIALSPSILKSWHQDVSASLMLAWTSFGLIGALLLSYFTTRRYDEAYDEVVRALNHNHIYPFFQPITDTRSGKVIGCEALARWIKPTGDFVPPSRFIPLIEDRSLNDRLLRKMLLQTDDALGDFLTENPDFYVSFNVTPRELTQKNFVVTLMQTLDDTRLSADQICLEITERQFLASPEAAADVTRELRRIGFRVAIDDAGTGHNGLAALQKLDVSTVKIDKYFIDHIGDDPRSRVMVDMFVSVARRYDMTTIAEGVETQEQLAVLKTAGVHAFQGYLFSKPLPAQKFLDALSDGWNGAEIEESDNKLDLPAISATTSDSVPPTHSDHKVEDDGQDEAARLEALYRLQILDTNEEEVFDRIPRMIKQALNVPMAAIALIDEDRRWFKSVSGGKRGQISRRDSFCNVTIQNADPTIVTDTLEHDVFKDNVLVQNAPHIRAYLGVPLVTGDGYRIGSVCCVDKQPRVFSAEDIQLVKDMSLIVMEQMEMRTLALFDPLTSARTRRGFCSEAKHRLEFARLTGTQFALAMLDIDHFKTVNDRFGHSAGDEILSGVGQRIAEHLPDDALFGRMGGEEFALALPNKSIDEALAFSERLRQAIETPPFVTKWGSLEITVSVGVAQADGLTQGLEELLEQADWALYEAKGKGRNRVVTNESRAA